MAHAIVIATRLYSNVTINQVSSMTWTGLVNECDNCMTVHYYRDVVTREHGQSYQSINFFSAIG